MICLFKSSDRILGSLTSVRAGDASELAYQIFFRDGLKMLLDKGHNEKNADIKKQIEYAESVYQAQCNNTITLDMIRNYNFSTDFGGFECVFAADTAEQIDKLCEMVLDITEKKRLASAAID